MAEAPKTDLVMQFVLDGQPVWAECALDAAPGDSLMTDFISADYDHYSSFFEVRDFNFGISLKEGDESTNVLAQPSRDVASAAKPGAATGAYARWRSASQSEYRKINYPLEFDKFSFTRVIDRASPIFFQNCCTSKTFDSAVLVKRLAQGGDDPTGGARSAVGYLRIDFTDVLITGVDWDDGDMVQEQCEFICKSMKIRYRRQLDDGTVDGSGETQATWPNPNNDRSLGIRFGGRRA